MENPVTLCFSRYAEGRRNGEIEKHIVEAMYHAASIAMHTDFERMIRSVAESDYGLLSKEFGRVWKDIENGDSPDYALERAQSRISSRIARRALNILANGYRTGADLSIVLREVAEDIEKVMEIDRDSRASMVVQKYTILFAGGVLVPLILGSMINLVSGLELSSLYEIGIASDSSGIMQNALLGNQIYITLYSVMAAVFLAHQEGRIENALVYALALLPLSLSLFSIAAAGMI